jgi:hypothetical protein
MARADARSKGGLSLLDARCKILSHTPLKPLPAARIFPHVKSIHINWRPPMHTTTDTARPGGIRNVLRRGEDWLDAKGKWAWIAAMVLSFVIFWPVGLALLA